MGGLISLLYLVFIGRSLIVSVEVCFYKSIFSIEYKKFLSKTSYHLNKKTNIEGKLRNFMTLPGSVLTIQ